MKYRYFKQHHWVWKFQEGNAPMTRWIYGRGWIKSDFASFDEFLVEMSKNDGDPIVEIEEEEGEP